MRGTAQKLPFVRSLNNFAAQKVLTKIRETGRSLPCSVVSVAGAIVTVKFEMKTQGQTLPLVTVPVQTSINVREPIQAGDLGYCNAADVYLGGMSGLGGGVADMTERGNLTCLSFQPLGNANWAAVDPNAVVIGQNAPNGVVLRDKTNASTLTLTPTSIILTVGGHTLEINSTGIILDGIIWLTHAHGDVMSGGDATGPPIP